jgi:hypothetical protein
MKYDIIESLLSPSTDGLVYLEQLVDSHWDPLDPMNENMMSQFYCACDAERIILEQQQRYFETV